MLNLLTYSSTSFKLLALYKMFLVRLFDKLGLKFIAFTVPQKKKQKTFLKGPHINKRAKENFKFFIYKFKIKIYFNFNSGRLFRVNVPKNIHLKMEYLT